MPISQFGRSQIRAVASKYTVLIGDGDATEFTITPGFTTQSCIVQVFDDATGDMVGIENVRIRVNSDTQVVLVFAEVPTLNQYRVVIVG